jgi:hypothetical protein
LIFFAKKFAKPNLFIVSLHRISETPRFLLPNPVKLARTLTRFEQGFNEVFKNPLQREIVVFGRILATAISPPRRY